MKERIWKPYYYNGVYYVEASGGCAVVAAPGYATVDVNGVKYHLYGGVHYRPYYQNGAVVYRVVKL